MYLCMCRYDLRASPFKSTFEALVTPEAWIRNCETALVYCFSEYSVARDSKLMGIESTFTVITEKISFIMNEFFRF